MATKAIDKSKWGAGPWQDEPDRIEFEAHGLPCLMLRQPRLGHWCGYAAVPPGHPLHGKGYDDVYEAAPHVSVHGGLTYADKCSGGICHVPKPGESDDVWWFGFDCAHCDDFSPAFAARRSDFLGGSTEYRDAAYVRAETERLARQLTDAATSRDAAGIRGNNNG